MVTAVTTAGTNVYAANALSGSAGYNQEDLMTAVVLRMTNAMGIASNSTLLFQTGGFLINTGVSDTTTEGGGIGINVKGRRRAGIKASPHRSDVPLEVQIEIDRRAGATFQRGYFC